MIQKIACKHQIKGLSSKSSNNAYIWRFEFESSKHYDKIMPFNGYAVDVYNFDGEVDLFVEKVFGIEVMLCADGHAYNGAVVRSVFSSTSDPEHAALFFIDDKYNVFNDEDNLVIIENENLLSALKNLCDHLASKYKADKLPVKSVGFSLGSYSRTYKVSLTDDMAKEAAKDA